MYITHYNTVTKGEFELDYSNLYDLFPKTTCSLVDYIVGRDYGNAGDPRYRIKTVGLRMRPFTTAQSFSFKSVAKTRHGDEYSEDAGVASVRRKLHAKARKVVDGIDKALCDQIDKMVEAVNATKIPVLPKLDEIFEKDVARLRKDRDGVFYILSDKTSIASFYIPLYNIPGGYMFPSLGWFVEGVCNSVEYSLLSRKRVSAMERRFAEEFVDELRESIFREIRNRFTFVENPAYELSDGAFIHVKTKVVRNPNDENDLGFAARKLHDKLQNAWCRICRRVQKIAVTALLAQKEHPTRSRWDKAIELNEAKCRSLGVI